MWPGTLLGVHAAFGTVVVVVCGVAIVVALIVLARSGRTWSEHGKSGLIMDHDLPRASGTGPPDSPAARETEIRELLEARNARRARRGEPPLDVEHELARLIGEPAGGRPSEPAPLSPVDPELREEVRALVLARNHRRERHGQPPLDVEAEIERELRRLSEL